MIKLAVGHDSSGAGTAKASPFFVARQVVARQLIAFFLGAGLGLLLHNTEIIKKAIQIASVHVSGISAIWHFLSIVGMTLLLTILCLVIVRGRSPFAHVDHPLHLFNLLLGAMLGAIVLFAFSSVQLSVHFLFVIICVAVFAMVVMGFMSTWRKLNPTSAILNLFGDYLRFAAAPIGIAYIAMTLAPAAMAVVYKSNRDVANWVTEMRTHMTQQEETPFALEKVFAGTPLNQPIDLVFHTNNESHALILERRGRIFEVSESAAPRLLLDFSLMVSDLGTEDGALGFAVHPDFDVTESGDANYVFVIYTSNSNGPLEVRLSRFDIAAEDPIENELRMIVQERSDGGFHNAGQLRFGPEGLLYVSLGDMEDKESHQRIDRRLAGGILRIDVDCRPNGDWIAIQRQPVSGRTQGYCIPDKNPFVGSDGLSEFYAIGLRNPFRFSIDEDAGQIWVGDVGHKVWEEINIVEAGGNYQFPFAKGPTLDAAARPKEVLGSEKPPYFYYAHNAHDRAVIGGVVYRGGYWPDLYGKYVFADNHSGRIWAIETDLASLPESELLARSPLVAQQGLTTIVTGPQGGIYGTSMGSPTQATGLVWRLGTGDNDIEVVAAAQDQAAADGAAIYKANCSRCHGATGAADGPDSRSFGLATMPNFASVAYQAGTDEDWLMSVVREGGEPNGLSSAMPPWQHTLSREETEAVISYLRAIGTDRTADARVEVRAGG